MLNVGIEVRTNSFDFYYVRYCKKGDGMAVLSHHIKSLIQNSERGISK